MDSITENSTSQAIRGIPDCCDFFAVLALLVDNLKPFKNMAFFDAEAFHPGFERRRFDVQYFGGGKRFDFTEFITGNGVVA